MYQKPFSMFLLCGTIAAVIRYWIFYTLVQIYQTDTFFEAQFFHEYMVIMYIALVPFYALTIYLLFIKSGYNYAEVGVMLLYTSSIFFLLACLICFLKFIFPDFDTAYVELPLFTFYLFITLFKFFKTIPWWIVAIKSLIIIAVIFSINQVMENIVIGLIAS
jgi:hypothetical protein